MDGEFSESFPDYTIFICKFKTDECLVISGRSRGEGPPKIDHLNFWWQPSFYPAFHFKLVIVNLYFLISRFLISFFNYNWKLTISIVYLSLTCIYSIMLTFSHLSLIIIVLNKICFYLFRSSYWEIFYKIATSVLNTLNMPLKVLCFHLGLQLY